MVAYVFPQNSVLQAGQIDAQRLTRINYAFANIANGRIVTGFDHDAENFSFLASLKNENPSLTVLVSVAAGCGPPTSPMSRSPLTAGPYSSRA